MVEVRFLSSGGTHLQTTRHIRNLGDFEKSFCVPVRANAALCIYRGLFSVAASEKRYGATGRNKIGHRTHGEILANPEDQAITAMESEGAGERA